MCTKWRAASVVVLNVPEQHQHAPNRVGREHFKTHLSSCHCGLKLFLIESIVPLTWVQYCGKDRFFRLNFEMVSITIEIMVIEEWSWRIAPQSENKDLQLPSPGSSAFSLPLLRGDTGFVCFLIEFPWGYGAQVFKPGWCREQLVFHLFSSGNLRWGYLFSPPQVAL